MRVKPYKYPDSEGKGDMVSEPVAVYPSAVSGLDVLRHQVMEAVASSDDKITLVLCLDMLKGKHKHHRCHSGKSDEELAAALAETNDDWERTAHPDLSQIDYSKYQPYRSPKIKKIIEKWL